MLTAPTLGLAPIACFAFGILATFRYFMLDKQLERNRLWEIVLLPMGLPSVIVVLCNLTSMQYRDNWTDFFILSSPIAVFWFVFWAAAARKEKLVDIAARIASEKHKVQYSRFRNSVPPLLIALAFIIASLLLFDWGLRHVPDWGPCTRLKCFAGEYILGSRSTIAAGLFSTSMFLSMVGLVPIRLISIMSKKEKIIPLKDNNHG